MEWAIFYESVIEGEILQVYEENISSLFLSWDLSCHQINLDKIFNP